MATKHPIKSITLTRAEGPENECGKPAILPSWELAEAVLACWARTVAPGCADKVDFTVVWEGVEDTYSGTFELASRHSLTGLCMLRDHAKRYFRALAGTRFGWKLRRPCPSTENDVSVYAAVQKTMEAACTAWLGEVGKAVTASRHPIGGTVSRSNEGA